MTDPEPRLMTPHLRRYDDIIRRRRGRQRLRGNQPPVSMSLPIGFGDTTRTNTIPDHHGGWMQATSPHWWTSTPPRHGPDRYDPHH